MVSSTGGVGKSVQGVRKIGRSETGLTIRDKLGERKPFLLFVFNKKRIKKPRFLGKKKDCTSHDLNLGPQNCNSENHPVGLL